MSVKYGKLTTDVGHRGKIKATTTALNESFVNDATEDYEAVHEIYTDTYDALTELRKQRDNITNAFNYILIGQATLKNLIENLAESLDGKEYSYEGTTLTNLKAHIDERLEGYGKLS